LRNGTISHITHKVNLTVLQIFSTVVSSDILAQSTTWQKAYWQDHSFIQSSVALQPFVGPWLLLTDKTTTHKRKELSKYTVQTGPL
jgi:hypothetical protein